VPLFQNGVLVRNLLYENEFDLDEHEPVGGTHFPMIGFARRLVLTEGQLGKGLLAPTRNSRILFFFDVIISFHQVDVCTANGKVTRCLS